MCIRNTDTRTSNTYAYEYPFLYDQKDLPNPVHVFSHVLRPLRDMIERNNPVTHCINKADVNQEEFFECIVLGV